MVRTNQFIGKRKVKDRWHDGGYVIVEQFDDWPVYKIKCPPTGKQRKHTYQILHRNCLMLVTSEDDSPHDAMHLQVAAAIVLNADIEAFLVRMNSSQEPEQFRPSLLTRQNREQTSHVWWNGEFRTKPWTQMEPFENVFDLQFVINQDIMIFLMGHCMSHAWVGRSKVI